MLVIYMERDLRIAHNEGNLRSRAFSYCLGLGIMWLICVAVINVLQ